MAEDITLRFVPPDDPDIRALIVYEAPSSSGPFTQIDRTLAVGEYPDWIDYYICQAATDKTHWFAIAWEDTSGAVGIMSQAVRGGTETLVGHIMSRVRQRDPNLDEDIVRQEAEGAIEAYFRENPYDISLDDLPVGTQYQTLNGLVYMTMARSYLMILTSSDTPQSATMGLVSMKGGRTVIESKNIERLIEMANTALGLSYTVVMLLEEVQIGNSVSNVVFRDQSRLVLETEIL